MFKVEETGPEIQGNNVRFRIYLPSIEKEHDFSVKVYVINKRDQFDVKVPAKAYTLNPEPTSPADDTLWGEVAKSRWCSEFIPMEPGTYIYRFEISGPELGSGNKMRSLCFGDPCARETDIGIFSVFRIPAEKPSAWEDSTFKVPPLDEIILYELNVAEFGGTFTGVADRIPLLAQSGRQCHRAAAYQQYCRADAVGLHAELLFNSGRTFWRSGRITASRSGVP